MSPYLKGGSRRTKLLSILKEVLFSYYHPSDKGS